MPHRRSHGPRVESKLVGTALCEEVPFEEHAIPFAELKDGTQKLAVTLGCLRPENGIVGQPFEYPRALWQSGNLNRHLCLLGPTILHNGRTSQCRPFRTHLLAGAQEDHRDHEGGG